MLYHKPLTIVRRPEPAATRPPASARPAPVATAPLGDVLDAVAASPSPRLLKPEEVAAMLGVSERTLERWRMTGDGPGFVSLTRKTVRYTAAALNAFIQGHVKANTAK